MKKFRGLFNLRIYTQRDNLSLWLDYIQIYLSYTADYDVEIHAVRLQPIQQKGLINFEQTPPPR